MIKHQKTISTKMEKEIEMNINEKVKTHFEYLGYGFIPDQEKLIAMKPGIPTLELIPFTSNQLIVGGMYPYNQNAGNNEVGFLRYINKLNLESLLTTFSMWEGHLHFYAAYTGAYDRVAFGQFIQNYEDDITNLLIKQDGTKQYIKSDQPQIDSDLYNLFEDVKCLA